MGAAGAWVGQVDCWRFTGSSNELAAPIAPSPSSRRASAAVGLHVFKEASEIFSEAEDW